MGNEIVNRVANSGLVTVDMAHYIDHTPRLIYDLKQNLFQEMILKEKEFRAFVKEHDWTHYKNKYVGLVCSADAIIPNWAYMILISKIQPYAKAVFLANAQEMEKEIIRLNLDEKLKIKDYQDKKVVVKGCAEINETEFAFAELTKRLVPVVSSLMFGEPCSTVPVFKRI